jgi:hypothetical protein
MMNDGSWFLRGEDGEEWTGGTTGESEEDTWGARSAATVSDSERQPVTVPKNPRGVGQHSHCVNARYGWMAPRLGLATPRSLRRNLFGFRYEKLSQDCLFFSGSTLWPTRLFAALALCRRPMAQPSNKPSHVGLSPRILQSVLLLASGKPGHAHCPWLAESYIAVLQLLSLLVIAVQAAS